MPIAPEHAFKEKSTKFYPSEPFTIAHFNVRHPVEDRRELLRPCPP